MPPQSEPATYREEDLTQKYNEAHQIKDRKIVMNVFQIFGTMMKFDYSTVIWRNVFAFLVIHLMALKGIYLLLTFQFQWLTAAVMILYILFTIVGTTMGAHRLWAHRTYKAKLPLRIFLAVLQTTAWQRDIYDWVRDHRVHHKYSETDADPHNARRGLFFAHMGWLMCQKHPNVIAQGKKNDYSDVLSDPVVVFQRKYYIVSSLILSLVIPVFVPWYYWGETVSTAFYVAVMLRYVLALHGTWSVNSFAHWVGNRPFNGFIYPAQNKWVSLLSGGEGWHNYHHAFPYDYRAAELGGFTRFNYIATFIELCAKVGLAYDLRVPSDETIESKAKNAGDGSFQGLGVSN